MSDTPSDFEAGLGIGIIGTILVAGIIAGGIECSDRKEARRFKACVASCVGDVPREQCEEICK